MKIKNITCLGVRGDLKNQALDVIVEVEDKRTNTEFCYVVEVTTPEFLLLCMEKSESNFIEPQYPYIIVSKLTDEIIKSALQSYIDTEEDSYWLKLYHIVPTLQINEINEILQRKEEEDEKLDAEVDAKIQLELEAEIKTKLDQESDLNQ